MISFNFIDPYEQKLFNLFKNFEVDGRLNENGLTELCHQLQLKEQFPLLVNLLFKNGINTVGVTFDEFREGLLHVITSEDGNESQLIALFFLFTRYLWVVVL